ncbi:hypothetical protein AB0L53_24055 [Nonomuraea sp. NPDC052129]|uniref:DUF1648 domain-containing protein n=1 Tax=Nonomuraea sp. NPDC052129 TaxID=3154651 RepID=UPI00341B1B13
MTLTAAAGPAAIVLVTCLALAMPALAKPTLPFGVRVPHPRTADPAVIAQRRVYARLTLAAGAAALSVLFLAGASREAVIATVTTALAMTDLLLYYRSHRKVRAAKLTGGWQREQRHGVTVDTTFRTDPVRLPRLWTLPAVAITLVTAGLGWWRYDALPATLPSFRGVGIDPTRPEPLTPLSAFEPVILQVAIILLFSAMTLLLLRARPDLDAARPAGSARRYRLYLRGTARLSLLGAACVNLTLLIAALQLWQIAAPTIVWGAAAYLALAGPLIGSLIWEIRAGQAGHRLPALPGEDDEDSGVAQRDDDKHWFLAGTVYVNRRDPAVVLHARLSQTWTLNLGHPVVWALVTVLAVAGLLAAFGVIDLPRRS